MKPVVLCDVDGVIADFASAVLETLMAETTIYHEVSGIKEYEIQKALKIPDDAWNQVCSVIDTTRFAYNNIYTYPGAGAVARLMKIADVYFVTKPWRGSDTWCADRVEWLCDHFGDVADKVIFTGHKHLIRADMFIDDHPETLRKWVHAQFEAGQPMPYRAILWDRL